MTASDLDLKAATLGILVKHQGERNAIKGKELARLLGFKSDRVIRKVIEELEKEKPIAATTGKHPGFFIPETPAEAVKYRKVLRSRVKKMCIRYWHFKKSAGFLLDKAAQGKLI